jgi:uncharacterized membrane protein
VALHLAGTVCLGGGIYLAGQILNLEEHWPGGIMLWAFGAVVAWLLLKQWPQALLAAILIPWWLAGEWDVLTDQYRTGWNIAAQGLLLIAIIYLTTAHKASNRHLRVGLTWVGAVALLPFIVIVLDTAAYPRWSTTHQPLPLALGIFGYAVAFLPALGIAAITRKAQALPVFAAAAWILVLRLLGTLHNPESDPWAYLWVGLGACAFCFWGVQANRKLFINYGTAIFAVDVIAFYFSSVLDKLGRSMGLILLGVIFLAGGWVLNRLRSDLIARAAAAGGTQ